jgi:hypothetical protein
LPDILLTFLHKFYTQFGLKPELSDDLVTVSLLFTAALILSMGDNTLTVMRRYMLITGFTYIIRSITVVITVLPNPLTECESQIWDNLFYDAFQLYIRGRVTCGDVFFSGHTILFTMTICLWMTYSRNRIMQAIAVGSSVLGMITLVASAYHYTVDVLFGYLVTSWTWSLYHWTITYSSFRKSRLSRFLYHIDNSEVYDRRNLLTTGSTEYFADDLSVIDEPPIN